VKVKYAAQFFRYKCFILFYEKNVCYSFKDVKKKSLNLSQKLTCYFIFSDSDLFNKGYKKLLKQDNLNHWNATVVNNIVSFLFTLCNY